VTGSTALTCSGCAAPLLLVHRGRKHPLASAVIHWVDRDERLSVRCLSCSMVTLFERARVGRHGRAVLTHAAEVVR